jgi:hypothetical protein
MRPKPRPVTVESCSRSSTSCTSHQSVTPGEGGRRLDRRALWGDGRGGRGSG